MNSFNFDFDFGTSQHHVQYLIDFCSFDTFYFGI